MDIGWDMAAYMGIRAMRELEVASHNLANTSTTGFKRELLNNWEITNPHLLGSGHPQAANYVDVRSRDLSQGNIHETVSGGTYTGDSSRTYVVEVVSGGGTGVGTYRVSVDGGQTWTTPAVIPAGPAALGDGVEVTMGGTWVAGDSFSISVYQPIEYQGDTHELEIAIGSQSHLVVNEIGSEAIGGDLGSNDLFQILAQLKGSLEANDTAEVGASLERLRSYEEHITSILAGLGASLDRVDMKENISGYLKDELTRQISDRGDTDLVAAANLLSAKETAYQAALLSSSKVMEMSLMDYL